MKNRYSLSVIVLLCIIFSIGCSDKEHRRRKNKKSDKYEFAKHNSKHSELIEAEKVAFFTSFLQLKPDEAKELWPIYDMLSNQKKQLWDKHHQILYKTRPEETISDETALEAIDSIALIISEISRIDQEMNKQALKILPPQKVLRLQHAEHHFKRYLLKNMRSKNRSKD